MQVTDLMTDLTKESFDYIIGTAILCHDQYPQNLKALHRLLKPGGQILFFEANYWNPQVFLKNTVPLIGRAAGQARCQVGMRKYKLEDFYDDSLMRELDESGFIDSLYE